MEALVSFYLKNAKDNAHLNAFVELYEEESLEQARSIDQNISSGEKLGCLFGAVLSMKDVICHKDHQCSAGSKMLQNFTSPYNATVIERWLQEDAIIIGRTNCDEFAMGSENKNSFYGPARNALDSNLIPGGSSGGTAISVAIDACLVGVGSDTGGSVRQPAAFHGLYGIKPTYGRLSRYGLIAYASSFDQIGIIAKSSKDLDIILNVAKGQDDYDSSMPSISNENIAAGQHANYKVAVLSNTMSDSALDPKIKHTIEKELQALEAKNCIVSNESLELLDYAVAAYYVLTSAEASSNLSRYDGIRFGHRAEKAKDLNEYYTKTRTEGFGPEVVRRIMIGTYVLSSGYYDGYFKKAQKVRRLVREQLLAILEHNDLILCPIVPTFPWREDSNINIDQVYLSDKYSVLANLAGLPSATIPLKIDDHLPTAYQVIAKPFQENKILSFLRDRED